MNEPAPPTIIPSHGMGSPGRMRTTIVWRFGSNFWRKEASMEVTGKSFRIRLCLDKWKSGGRSRREMAGAIWKDNPESIVENLLLALCSKYLPKDVKETTRTEESNIKTK